MKDIKQFGVEVDMDLDVRERMDQVFPWLRLFLNYVTGKRAQASKPRRWSPRMRLVASIAQLLGGVALAIAASSMTTWPLWLLLLLAWMLTVGAARTLQVTHVHHAIHTNHSGDARWDRRLARWLTVLLLIQNEESYQHDHLAHHKGRILTTLNDPDLRFLIMEGFLPGMSRNALWRKFWWTLVSPGFHARFFKARMRSNLLDGPMERRVWVAAYLAVMLVMVTLMGWWIPYLVAWVFPMIVAYQAAALAQFICEHYWARVKEEGESAKLKIARSTSGRFLGDPVPETSGRSWLKMRSAWMRWWLRLFIVHLPLRVSVLVGDLSQHDWHHRHAHDDWANAAIEREKDAAAGCPGWPTPYTEIWSLGEAIDRVFVLFASLPVLKSGSDGVNLAEWEGVALGM